jgi:hypothetical protein
MGEKKDDESYDPREEVVLYCFAILRYDFTY